MNNPEHWTIRSVGEICDRVTSGGTPSRARREFYVDGDIPWVKTGELRDQYINSSEERITPEAVRESSAKLLPRHTVLLAMYGATVGALGILDVAATCNQASCAMVVDSSQASARWLFYALLNDRDRIVRMATGAAQQNLSGKTIRQFEYSTPPLPEQQAIAEVLGALDDKIAANARLAATAEAFATALVATCSRAVPLSELAELSKAQSNPALLGSKLIDHYSLPAFDGGALPVTESADQIKSNKFVINQDVVLLSKLNPRFPRVWRAGADRDRLALASTEFLVLNPLGVSRELLWASLSQSTFASALDAKVAGTSGSHQRVRPADALATPILDPRGLDAARIAALEAALGLASSSRAESRTLAATRDALLPKLMSGQLRVKDAIHHAEEVL